MNSYQMNESHSRFVLSLEILELIRSLKSLRAH